MQNYRVQIDNDNYFSVDSKVIEFEKESIRIVNLRSIKGFIGKNFDLSDPKLKDIIQKYLRFSNNVELINIYSRKFNHYNWFEIYSNQENSEKQVKNEHGPYGPCSKMNENLELSEYIKISNEIDNSKINSKLKDSDNKLIPSKLYENMNQNLPKFKKLDINSMNFIPIWYINGSLQTNAKYCELFTTFEILIHILSKRFITFKSQLLSISSTFIQRAKFCGFSIEKYLEYEKEDLAKLLLEKDNLIVDLNREIQNLNQNILDLKTESSGLKDEIKDLKGETVNLKNELHTNSSILSSVLTNTNKIIESSMEYHENISSRDKHLKNKIETKLPQRIITTDSTNEILLLFVSKSLNDKLHLYNDNITEEDIIINSISCQTENLQKELIYHEFNQETDKILFRTIHGNSLDLNRFVKNNGSIIRPLTGYIRKFVVKKSNINTLKQELDRIMNKSSVPRDQIIYDINKSEESLIKRIYNPISEISSSISNIKLENENSKEEIKEILSIMNQKLNNLETGVNENKSEIKNINKEIRSLSDKLDSIKNVIVSKEVLISLFGDVEIEIYSNKRYRPIYHKNNETRFPTRVEKGTIKDSELLTYEKLMNSIIRTSSNVYKPEANKKLLLNNNLIMNIEA